jgi:hypothetical protein
MGRITVYLTLFPNFSFGLSSELILLRCQEHKTNTRPTIDYKSQAA